MALSDVQIDRYARHILLPEVGGVGQEKLLASKVLIVGAGGLGCPAALYLAAAGVGQIGLVDFDEVDLTNLQRQILYHTEDIGKPKANTAVSKLETLNPDVTLKAYPEKLTATNAEEIFSDYDLIIDGTDNFDTRYLVNDICVKLKKPNVFGSVLGFEGQASVFMPDGPCYRCVFSTPPPEGAVPRCAEAGVIGVATGLVGLIQASEAIKTLLNIGESLSNRLLLIDALHMSFDEVHIEKHADCPTCGISKTVSVE